MPTHKSPRNPRQHALSCAALAIFAAAAPLFAPQALAMDVVAESARFTIDQTLSDEAQRTTIAFDGLAFLTGSLGSDSFFPPGKVADFWGFQYLRDNDPTEMGHNTDFLTKASLNTLTVLTAGQRQALIVLAKSQVDSINEYGYERFVLMKAFRRLLDGDLPAGATGLDRDAVKAESAKLYRLDGQISYERAKVMGAILGSLTTSQRVYLDAMVGKGMLTWPTVEEPSELRGLTHDEKVAVMTYAGDLFSWYAGSIEADVYFCPERQGTYFGSFYMKDAPAVGNPDYTIDSNLTANGGRDFLAALSSAQAASITGLVDIQRPYLLQIVETRRAMATELRRFIAGQAVDQAEFLELAETYGELDGEIVYQFATSFASVGASLTASQKAQLAALRTKILGDFAPTGAYLYATPIAIPAIANTDFLFGVSASPGGYRIVDTGQTVCYGNSSSMTCPQSGQSFHGQDAQHQGNQPAYELGSEGLTVIDLNTGLTWQRSPDTNGDGVIGSSDKLTWAQAQARPAALNAAKSGGFTDWRLPTIRELYSLMNFRGTDPSGVIGNDTSGLTPFIDTAYFKFAYGDTGAGERIIDSQYASSTVYVDDPGDNGSTMLFGVNFADGRIKGYDLTTPDGSTKTFFVQCVRGDASYGVNDLADNGDGTITDRATGLMWSKGDSAEAMNWQSALAWVQAKNAQNYLGHDDWRLPDAKELHSIVDYARAPDVTGSAAIDPLFQATQFTNEAGVKDYPWYWTSTTHAGAAASGAPGSSAVYLAFGRAGGWMKKPPSSGYYTFADVHGAGAQRSDPKSGSVTPYLMGVDSAGKPVYGHGPQGDVIRVANYVRLVRDAESSGSKECPATALCLLGERFQLSLAARDQRTGSTGEGVPAEQSDFFGFFSLPSLTADSSNPEVFVKMLDGRATNGNFWLFYGGLTDLEYTLTVKDTVAGTTKRYTKPAGSSAGGFDVGAGAASESCPDEVDGAAATDESPGACVGGANRLCLTSSRFRVEVSARDWRTGKTARGVSIPENDRFGCFSLPDLTGDASNPEVFVKLLDGRSANGFFWIFFSGLTDLEYDLTVTDTVTGKKKLYTKAAGSACGAFDVNAF